MDKILIYGLFGHFHMEVNPEMIPILSQGAAESLKIESLSKLEILFLKIQLFSYF
jgi:hypothetical protein